MKKYLSVQNLSVTDLCMTNFAILRLRFLLVENWRLGKMGSSVTLNKYDVQRNEKPGLKQQKPT